MRSLAISITILLSSALAQKTAPDPGAFDIGATQGTGAAKQGPRHPQTPQAHLTERYTRIDSLTLKYEVTIDDPGAYSKPWTTSNTVSFRPGFQLMEFICNENEKDSAHMTKERALE
jgi:hypothetical protein